jgi:hypothetical protein
MKIVVDYIGGDGNFAHVTWGGLRPFDGHIYFDRPARSLSDVKQFLREAFPGAEIEITDDAADYFKTNRSLEQSGSMLVVGPSRGKASEGVAEIAATATDVVRRIDYLFDYVKSGILINTISYGEDYMSGNIFLAGWTAHIHGSVYVDTPSREVVVATLMYPKYTSDEDSREYYILLAEEFYGAGLNIMLAQCNEELFDRVTKMIEGFKDWAKENSYWRK